MRYPFAENEAIVALIWHDLGYAIWGAPVLFVASVRLAQHIVHRRPWGVARAASAGVAAIAWISSFMIWWAIPKPTTLDLNALDADLAGGGRIGYFECAITLKSGRSIEWSARKLSTWTTANGERYLWIEGNADEPDVIAAGLKTASDALLFTPPETTTLAALADLCTDNRTPLWTERGRSQIQPATVLVFHEPNGLVTPCLVLGF